MLSYELVQLLVPANHPDYISEINFNLDTYEILEKFALPFLNRHVQFRYNLGNGPVILTSPERVTMKTFHSVAAKRYHKDGVLIFNDGEDVVGQSQGMLKSLDLNQDTFVGNMPTNYSK